MIEDATIRTLSCGPLAFTAVEAGPADGPLVLCLHGFPDTARTFRLLLPALAEAGFRAVAVAMRGYEPSSIPPDGDYRAAALADDVAAWMDALDAERAFLVGHDWGAATAYGAAIRHGARIPAIATMAVPHPRRFTEELRADIGQMRRSSYMIFFQMRGLAEAWVRAGDFAFFDRIWRRWSPGFAPPAEDLAALKQAMAKPGVLEAALGYYRCAFDRSPAAAESAAFLARPVPAATLALVGEKDGCIGADFFRKAMRTEDFSADLTVETVPDAGHFLHLERPDEIARKVVAFLDDARTQFASGARRRGSS